MNTKRMRLFRIGKRRALEALVLEFYEVGLIRLLLAANRPAFQSQAFVHAFWGRSKRACRADKSAYDISPVAAWERERARRVGMEFGDSRSFSFKTCTDR